MACTTRGAVDREEDLLLGLVARVAEGVPSGRDRVRDLLLLLEEHIVGRDRMAIGPDLFRRLGNRLISGFESANAVYCIRTGLVARIAFAVCSLAIALTKGCSQVW